MRSFMKKTIFHILFLIAYIALLWGYNTNLNFVRPGDYPEGLEYAKATVVEVVEDDMGLDPDYDYIRIGKQTLKLEITSGDYKGTTV